MLLKQLLKYVIYQAFQHSKQINECDAVIFAVLALCCVKTFLLNKV